MNVRSSLLLLGFAAFAGGGSLVAFGCGAQVLDVGTTGKPGDPAAAGDAKSDGAPGQSSDPSSWFPSSNCAPVGATAKLLVEAAPDMDVRGLVPDGDTLWFDSYQMTAQTANGHLASVPVAGGVPTPLKLPDYYRGLAGIFDGRLVYVRAVHAGDGTKTDPTVEQVEILDRAKSTVTSLPNPRATTYVSGVTVHPSGIYWLSREWDATVPESISRWNTSMGTELTTIANHSSVITDGNEVFYTRWDDHGGSSTTDITFEAVPVAGGAPRVLRHMLYDQKFAYDIVGVDDVDVYFTQESLVDGGAIDVGDLRAIKKDGTGERLLVSGQKYGVASFHVDPDFVMWTDQDAQQTLVRVRRSGGALERIVPGAPNRWVSASAVDRCNIYWAVENPPAVYARSRLP